MATLSVASPTVRIARRTFRDVVPASDRNVSGIRRFTDEVAASMNHHGDKRARPDPEVGRAVADCWLMTVAQRGSALRACGSTKVVQDGRG